jgi:hypothetical protein
MKKNPGNGKETSSSLHQICSKRDVKYIKRLRTSYSFPFFKVIPWSSSEVFPLLAAISAEKSPLLACIKGRVAAEDDDHFATVWSTGRTDRQIDRRRKIER